MWLTYKLHTTNLKFVHHTNALNITPKCVSFLYAIRKLSFYFLIFVETKYIKKSLQSPSQFPEQVNREKKTAKKNI